MPESNYLAIMSFRDDRVIVSQLLDIDSGSVESSVDNISAEYSAQADLY